MSDTLADLATWLPSEFLTGHVPYDFASSSSTESESDDDDFAGLTRRFTRSVSLQERLKIPYPLEKKRGFSSSPESTLNWNVSQIRSSPKTLFGQPNEDSWDLIYAAASQVARMKVNTNAVKDGVFGNRGLLGAPRPLGAPHSHHHYLPDCAVWTETEAFIRQRQFRPRMCGGANYDCGGRCGTEAPIGFRQSAWPPLPVENHRHQHSSNGFAVKPVPTGFSGGSGRGKVVVKKERSGTGVFLPRNYGSIPPEPKKTAACSFAQLPAVVAQQFNKHMDPVVAQPLGPQTPIHGGVAPPYQVPPLPHHFQRGELSERVTDRRNAVMYGPQRRSTAHVGVLEARMGQPEVVLPQEWTY